MGEVKLLKSENRLKKRKEFNYVFKMGKVVSSENLKMFFINANRTDIKFGFTITKKIGKAYVRNKIKRRLSSIIYPLIKNMKNNYTVVIKAAKDISETSFVLLSNDVLSLLKKAGIIEKNVL